MTASAETRPCAGTVGADVPRRDAEDKIRGWTQFTVDRSHKRMLHAAIRRADLSAARIVRIDTSTAEAMPGVRAVVTAADAPGLYGVGVADHPLFADGVVRYHGEPLVAVAAETLAQARAAAAAVEVELEPLPSHLTMAESLAPGALEIHPDWASYEELVAGGTRCGNVAWEATVVRGDTDAAFARDDVVVVESRFSSGRQNQTPLEPRVCAPSGRRTAGSWWRPPPSTRGRYATARHGCSASARPTSVSSYRPSAADSA